MPTLFNTVVVLALVLGVDILMAMVTGSTFYVMWAWLIVPTLHLEMLSWVAAVMVVFVVRFLVGKNSDIPDMENINDAWPILSRGIYTTSCRCFVYIGLAFLLSFLI